MKKTILLFVTVLMLFALANCGDDTVEPKHSDGPVHYGDTISISNEQVWERSYNANRPGTAYKEYKGSSEIIIISTIGEEVGSGAINGGVLNFTVNKPEQLLDQADLKEFFTVIGDDVGWDNVEFNNEATGVFILPITPDGTEALIREGVFGTKNSTSDETVYFIYVDRDCKISGKSKYIENVTYTFKAFELNLFAGWNTICYQQTYTSSGNSGFSMEIKNPDLKWVLISTTSEKYPGK